MNSWCLADTGEDQIVNCLACDYAANLERAEVARPGDHAPVDRERLPPIEEVETPDVRTIDQLSAFLSVTPDRMVKTLIFSADGDVVAALVRGDHELNEVKLKNFLNAKSIELADHSVVAETTGAPMGFAGPVGLKVKMVADRAIEGHGSTWWREETRKTFTCAT